MQQIKPLPPHIAQMHLRIDRLSVHMAGAPAGSTFTDPPRRYLAAFIYWAIGFALIPTGSVLVLAFTIRMLRGL